MGLEAYLFKLYFSKSVSFSRLTNFLLDYGFKVVKKEEISGYRNSCYELASKKGITETHILLAPEEKKVAILNVRFSVASPPNVIDQTFSFFTALNEAYGFKLEDTEISNQLFSARKAVDREWSTVSWLGSKPSKEAVIPIDAEDFKKNKLGIRKRLLVLTDDERKTPVRCGEEPAQLKREIANSLMKMQRKD